MPATFCRWSCTLLFIGFILIRSGWIVHLPCTYLLLVFIILRYFLTSPPKGKLFWLLAELSGLTYQDDRRFLLRNCSCHKLNVFLGSGRVVLRCLGFSNWFKLSCVWQKHSHDAALHRHAASQRCYLRYHRLLLWGYLTAAGPGPDKAGILAWNRAVGRCWAPGAEPLGCRAMGREEHSIQSHKCAVR